MTDKETIVNFLQQMVTQDCRSTAFPFFYVIKDYKNEFILDESDFCGESVPYFMNDEGRFLTFEEYNKERLEFDEPQLTEDEFENLDNIYIGYFREVSFIVENTLFLTETDAENHLKQNHYHYSPKAHTYVMHAWRAPELKNFIEALLSYFEVKNERI